MARLCCEPSEYDEDRTHSVNYWQAAYDGEPGASPQWEDHGTAVVACSHNDAVAEAELVADRFAAELPMRPRGRNGSWAGSDIYEGQGSKVEVWVSRGPSEEDYDAARLAVADGGTV